MCAHEIYPPVGYDYQAEHYCTFCIQSVLLGEENINKYIPTDGCACPECVLDRVAEDRGISRHDERSFDQDEFPKTIPYHNDLHADCGDTDEESGEGLCYSMCATCEVIIDPPCPGVSNL